MRWIITRKFLKDCPELIFFVLIVYTHLSKDRSTNCIATNTFNTFVRSFFFYLFFFFSPRGKSSSFEQYLAIVSGRLEITRRLLSLSGDKYAADAVDERRSFINHPLTRPHRFTQLYRLRRKPARFCFHISRNHRDSLPRVYTVDFPLKPDVHAHTRARTHTRNLAPKKYSIVIRSESSLQKFLVKF